MNFYRIDKYRWRLGDLGILELGRPTFGLHVGHSDQRWHLCLFGVYLPLGPSKRVTENHYEMWGFKLSPFRDKDLYLSWANKAIFIEMPWRWTHVDEAHKVRDRSAQWVTPAKNYYVRFNGNDPGDAPDNRWYGIYHYRYTLRSGEVQNRQALIYIEKREWRWRWFTWLPWPALKKKCIIVQFNDEIGEQVGSWKGGCISCAYEMRKGELPWQTLGRMEKERKFY